jgi:hypothetical protein
MFLSGQLSKQSLGGQLWAINMIKPAKLVIPHIIWYLSPQTFEWPTLTMHKQRAIKISSGENISSTQSQKRQKLEDNDPNGITT